MGVNHDFDYKLFLLKAHLTVLLLSTTWLVSRRLPIPARARYAVNCLAAMAWIQVSR